ncbi:ATP-binding protein [Spartinivicinus poritis]|uniref:ATP-binding protein n=1 Tax=Spartinivicinus poritis TaxID=2994640 RepID=A0ABT5UL22_9GAMM|nr:ATP-binding protein [Spartinivicinus sp. A2-2]MDE1465734.1 ATP-binding protein [Spartinivicinus sp. A2-2]
MKKWNTDTALLKFKKINSQEYDKYLSESDTRSKLIDYILIECLGWDETNIIREERCIDSGLYLDYKLSTNMPIIIIEAKKNSACFNLPDSSNQREYKVGGVLSKCKFLIRAMEQARNYSISKGILFTVVTNGNEYVFFRSHNQQGIEWVDHNVVIFRSHEDIEENFDLFCKLLSKTSAENGTIQKTLGISGSSSDEDLTYKILDTKYLNRPRRKDRNSLFPVIGDIIHRVFQDLASQEATPDILEHCYVDSPKKPDKKSPYTDIKTNELSVNKNNAGEFQQRILSTLKTGKTNHKEVILLIGSVGVGKSTFIQRFRKVLAKKEIDNDGIWIYFNFKNYSDTGITLDSFISSQIEKILINEYSYLGLDEWKFLKQVYHNEYEKLKRGPLAPLHDINPQKFELSFGEKVDEWSSEKREEHFTKILSTASKRLKKTIFLVFDNADQLNTETQNSIFLAAQKLTEEINCYALLAMREESYWKNRDCGPLNAFHTTAYNVQPASLHQVLSKRFNYTKSLIRTNEYELNSKINITKEELEKVFSRIIKTLLGSDQTYINFIESTAARDMRRALDTVAYFMISGHTNIDAILRDERKEQPDGFIIPFHEFLNSIILRDNEVYSESDCDTLNLFNTMGNSDISNCNIVAVLGNILYSKNSKSDIGIGYVLIEDIIRDCHSVGILPDTTTSILVNLNSRRLIETETTIKNEIKSSSYVRATISGNYYIEKLSKMIGYLSLIVYQTPICRAKTFKKLNRLKTEIDSFCLNDYGSRLNRVIKKMEMTEVFIDYLYSEFQRSSFINETNKFSKESINLVKDMKSQFIIERENIIKRAKNLFCNNYSK